MPDCRRKPLALSWTLRTLVSGSLALGAVFPAWANPESNYPSYRLEGSELVRTAKAPTPAKPAPAKPTAATKSTETIPAATAETPAGKVRVAIVDFRAIGASPTLAAAVTENLANSLIALQRFTVVERTQIQKALQEQAFGQTGMVEAKDAVSLGKLLGANVIVLGSVTRLGETLTINARFIDVQTGVAIDARNLSTNNESDLAAVVNQLAADLSASTTGSGGQAAVPANLNTVRRSKALAATLSAVVPGTGQFYGGNPSSGLLFSGLEVLGLSAVTVSLTALQCNPVGLYVFIPGALLTLANTIWSSAHAFQTTPEELQVVR